MQEKNKKRSELKNSNTRLKSMTNHATEFAEKSKKKEPEDKNVKNCDERNVKCKFENSGTCRRRSECKDSHPRKTCQAYSKLGSCPLESSCEHRHPFGVCYAWQRDSFCPDGENCRHRHPFELAIKSPNQDFLDHGSPSGRLGGQGQDSQRGQGQDSQRGQGRRPARRDSRQ